ncbi:hypothetical protein A2V61_02105 [Candidatus Woesebacteria bacterium RBG_19FT_COMBO_47_8]|uniref:Carbamoyltransferase n=1 Tax=Candidatus Woesebacteria bacterium RBG_13_46_13 TaxID=1802479 RepID=A0A1F7X5C5_9BACT|nr:MAG: hypothetical protein A2Y68_00580 [Candidatus Woesebacteria bacterium RBG_13_46_13]OGM18215.1 MAG: hypothetical protein A2V61_02105 [Candidatus Woesebacteria bacterium RBG_19FT_COMBO_47_8]HJX59410.1 carbamoyltransferase N-terminal domain-containing protein [Patescibacteria group bacterium]
MYILGINAFYHDSSAALIKDGEVVAAAEEERFTRIKHDNSFPFKAIKFCLESSNVEIADIDFVAYYEKPLLKFERILETFIETYPFSLKPFLQSIPEWLGQKIKVEWLIKEKVGFRGKIFFIPHHLSHAAAAFYPSGLSRSAVLTIDGVGEYETCSLWRGENNKLVPLKSIIFPHSLGLLYSTFTAFLGFRVNNDEYKLMGLAAYGKPRDVDKIHKIIDLKEDGSFRLNMDYFSFRQSFSMWGPKFERLFGSPRKRGAAFSQRHKDLAASIQRVTEEAYFKILRHLSLLTKSKNVCISGGVALNALANGKIFDSTPFTKVHILGPAGDGGTALGAALATYHQIKRRAKRKSLASLCLGTSYIQEEIEDELNKEKIKYRKFAGEEELTQKVSAWLAKGKVVGWFQGKMELGPRALGARSILARPYPRGMKERVNEIKRRESFRPFAGSVLQEKVNTFFAVPQKNFSAPDMNYCFEVRAGWQEKLAAIVHSDASCRIQTVSKNDGLYYKLIHSFWARTGIPCILNTSFNLAGEPIVESPAQAIADFVKTKMDFLVLGNFWLAKNYLHGKKSLATK